MSRIKFRCGKFFCIERSKYFNVGRKLAVDVEEMGHQLVSGQI